MRAIQIFAALIFSLLFIKAHAQDRNFPFDVDVRLQKNLALSMDKIPLDDPQKLNKLLDSALKSKLAKTAPAGKLTDSYNFYLLKTLAYSPTLDLVIFAYQIVGKGKRYYYFLNVYNKKNVLLASKEIGKYISTNTEETSRTAKVEGNGRISLYEDPEENATSVYRITPAGKIETDNNVSGANGSGNGGNLNPSAGPTTPGSRIQVIKGNRKVMRSSLYPSTLPTATINAVVKINSAGIGTFLGFAAGSTSNDKSYQTAVIEMLKRTLFDRAEAESLVTLAVTF